DEVLRIIREEEPPRPSTRLSTTAELPRIAAHRRTELSRLSRLLKGDLDWIVMKALDKDPDARYATARDLGDDLQRFLEDRPIKAKRPTVWQRLAKWSRRHRPLVASAVASLVAVLAVSVVVLLISGAQVAAALDDKNNAFDQLKDAKRETDEATNKAVAALTKEQEGHAKLKVKHEQLEKALADLKAE